MSRSFEKCSGTPGSDSFRESPVFLRFFFVLLHTSMWHIGPHRKTIEMRIAKVTTAHTKGDFSHHRQFEQHPSLKMWYDMAL